VGTSLSLIVRAEGGVSPARVGIPAAIAEQVLAELSALLVAPEAAAL
jgi:hypothetical protein